MSQGELDLGGSVLHGVGALQVGGLDHGRSDDLNGTGARAVSTGHFIVQLAHRTGQSHVSELAVHVVSTRPGIVTQPDAVVLDDPAVLFHKLNAVHDLTGGLLHFSELVQVVPELGLGNHWVGREHNHSVRFRIRVLFRGGVATHNLVLAHKS